MRRRRTFSGLEILASTLLLTSTIVVFGMAYTKTLLPSMERFHIEDVQEDMENISKIRTSEVSELYTIPNTTIDTERSLCIYDGEILDVIIYRKLGWSCD